LPDQVHCGLESHRARSRPMRAPDCRYFRSAWDYMAEMEATMTWKAPPSGSYLLAPRRALLRGT
jgi:hypothetical protein